MLKQIVCGAAIALLLGGAAPIAPPATLSPITQSRVVDQCFDDCVITCMWHSGAGETACQFECMMVTCLAEVPPGPTKLHSATRKE